MYIVYWESRGREKVEKGWVGKVLSGDLYRYM